MTKKINLILILSLIVIGCFSQVNTANHPTINSLKVSYKAAPQGTASLIDIKAIPQVTIALKPNSNATKIHLKIMNKETSAIIFQVSYNLNASITNNNQGFKLFENAGGVVYISNGEVLTLKPYLYEVKTEDSQENLSIVYSDIK